MSVYYKVFINAKNGAYSDDVRKRLPRKSGQPAQSIERWETEEEAVAFANEVISECLDNFDPDKDYISIGRFVDDEYVDGYDKVL